MDSKFDITHHWAEILSAHEGHPVTVYNDVDNCILPARPFTYANRSVYGKNIPKFDASFLIGCLQKGSNCMVDSECYDAHGKPHYSSTGLVQLPEYSMIKECGSWCKCSPSTCHNRVISRGAKMYFQIFKTKHCGWGVRTMKNIPKNTYVVAYVGEVIDNVEADKRGKVYDGQNSTYLFDLDFYDGLFDPNVASPLKASQSSSQSCQGYVSQNEFVIDAYNTGNVARFINHNCDGNLKVHPFSRANQDPRLHEIAFFANRDIRFGDELSYDYSGGQEYKGTSRFIACHCGFKKCKGSMLC